MNHTDNEKPQGVDLKSARIHFAAMEQEGKIKLNREAKNKVIFAIRDLFSSTTLGAGMRLGLGRQPLPEEKRKPVRQEYANVIRALQQAEGSLIHASEMCENAPVPVRRNAVASLENETMVFRKEWYWDDQTGTGQEVMTRYTIGLQEYAEILTRVAADLQQQARSFEIEFRAPRGRIGYPAFTTFVEQIFQVYQEAGGTRTYTYHNINSSFTGEALDFILEVTRQIEPMLRPAVLPPPSERQNYVGGAIRNLIRKREK